VINTKEPLSLQAVVTSGVQPSDYDLMVWSSPNATLNTFVGSYPGAGEFTSKGPWGRGVDGEYATCVST
jgi:hypothetical protein